MRTINSAKNITAGIIGQILTLVLSFISRTLFVMILNVQYLGVSSLFSNIITLLSFTELGIGTAIIYSLYKPLAENNEDEILALMNLFKRVYKIIGVITFVIGIALIPFLNFFVPDRKGIMDLEWIFFLFIINTSVSYFFTYNRTLITADQKAYKLYKIDYMFRVLMVLFPIGWLLITRNYFVYLIAQIIITIAQNLFVYLKVQKEYPILKIKSKPSLDPVVKKQIVKNTAALIIYKIAIVSVNGTDNILISSFFGMVAVGLYANYYLIVQNLSTLITQVMQAITASVGNLSVIESDEKKYEIFHVVQFMNFWIYSFVTICLFMLFNPFVTLWLGEKYLLDIWVVLPICLMFYTLGMQTSVSIFRDAQGLFWHGKFRPIAQAVVNLIASIVLVKLTGSVAAIFWGTVISRVTTTAWYDPYVVHKHGFHKPLKKYFVRYGVYVTAMLVTGALCLYLGYLMPSNLWLNFLSKALICLVVPNALFFVLFSRMEEFKYLAENIIYLLSKYTKHLVRNNI